MRSPARGTGRRRVFGGRTAMVSMVSELENKPMEDTSKLALIHSEHGGDVGSGFTVVPGGLFPPAAGWARFCDIVTREAYKVAGIAVWADFACASYNETKAGGKFG